MRKLYIHIGPPKTGTSAVQYILNTYPDKNVLYPNVGLWSDGAHHNLVLNYFEDFRRPEVIRGDIKFLFEQIGALARNSQQNIVISSEDLVGRLDLDSFVHALLSNLNNGDWTAEIVFVCREHFERTASLYNQMVKDFVSREPRLPDEYLRQQAKQLCYAPTLMRLQKGGFPLTILNYHPSKDFVPRFLTHVGFAGALSVKNESRNISLSPTGLIATLAANQLANSTEDRQRYFAAFEKAKWLFSPFHQIFSKDAMLDVEALFKQDRDFLQTEFGIVLPAPDLSTVQGKFFISNQELLEISDAARCLGAEGDALVSIARSYVKAY